MVPHVCAIIAGLIFRLTVGLIAMLLDRYLVREISVSSLAVAVVLTVIFLAYSLTRFLTEAAGGLIKATEVAHLTFYKSIIALEVLLPLALFFGLIVGCGRLNTYAELTAMQAAGLGRARLHRPLLLCGVLLAALVAGLSFSVRPWAYQAMFALKAQADASSDLDRIKAQRFYLYDDEQRAVYIETLAEGGRKLGGIFIRERNAGDIEVISAPSGRLEPYVTPDRHRLVLDEASVYRSSAGNSDFYGSFGTLTLSINAGRAIETEYRTKSASTAALFAATDANDRAELQWRLSTPVSTLLLAMTALSLTDLRPRQSRYTQVPLALAIYALYYNLLALARTWVEQDVVSTLWWVPALLASALLWRAAPTWLGRHG